MSDILERLMAQLTAVARRVAHLETLEGGGGAGHDAVTLDADAAVLLDLSTQEIGLDTQAANMVFAGPTTGAANEPTFRALVIADAPANGRRHIIWFSMEGNLTTGDKPLRIYPPTGDWTIEKVRAAVNTAPAVQAILVDVQLNGVTIFTDQGKRPSIAAAGFLDDSDAPDVNSCDGDDYFQFGVDQIGTGTTGADLTVGVCLLRV